MNSVFLVTCATISGTAVHSNKDDNLLVGDCWEHLRSEGREDPLPFCANEQLRFIRHEKILIV